MTSPEMRSRGRQRRHVSTRPKEASRPALLFAVSQYDCVGSDRLLSASVVRVRSGPVDVGWRDEGIPRVASGSCRTLLLPSHLSCHQCPPFVHRPNLLPSRPRLSSHPASVLYPGYHDNRYAHVAKQDAGRCCLTCTARYLELRLGLHCREMTVGPGYKIQPT